MKKVTILGSTGSIGTQALDVIRKNSSKLQVAGLTCRSRIEVLEKQIEEFRPAAVSVGSEEDGNRLRKKYPELEVFWGEQGLTRIAAADCDIVLNSLMGISGLRPTYEAINHGHTIALANKETLVAGGELITELAREKDVSIIPVDSEHSAIFQCLQASGGSGIKRILLTASGGPFKDYSIEDLENVTLEQALNHPKWSMGSKITVDSATMMNKGLEVIEARWLFDVAPDQIQIHVHPESIVHSMVEFQDTSIIAQMGLPDMRLPISYAFGYPERMPFGGDSLDFFTMASTLHFQKPRRDVFRCIDLAYDALKMGKGATCYLNGANEELVKHFLNRKIRFLDIQNTLERLMNSYNPVDLHTVDELLALDRKARSDVNNSLGLQ